VTARRSRVTEEVVVSVRFCDPSRVHNCCRIWRVEATLFSPPDTEGATHHAMEYPRELGLVSEASGEGDLGHLIITFYQQFERTDNPACNDTRD